ncbi:MAG: ATP-dependent helicase [Chloroflexi bacterium]|nr:ATP-dependent helicase [Chloroflexota bacterium]
MSQINGDNDAASRIAESNASTLRILAGPGTGKTHTLKLRVAHLIRENVPPSRILATTFTRTAAEDLQLELAGMDVDGASAVHASTIHSLCFSILRKESVLEFSGREPRTLFDFEKQFLIEDLVQAGVGNKTTLKELFKDFSAAWARDQLDTPGWPSRPIDNRFATELDIWLRFHKAMLIEELVPEALRFLRANPESRERRAFKHVLVDEYQDLNVAEQEFIRLITDCAEITVVGDEDQSIYSFKHAHPEGISQFHVRHPGTIDENLDVCRRCPENILEMANCLISKNQNRSNRSLIAFDELPTAEVDIVQWRSMEEEVEGIAKFTAKLVTENSVKAGRILILAPIKEIGYEIRDALNGNSIPAHSFYKEEELDQNPRKRGENRILEAITLLRLVADQDDHVALRSWCGFGSPSLRSGSWRRVLDLCISSGKPLPEVLEDIASGEEKLKNDFRSELYHRVRELGSKLEQLVDLNGRGLFDALFPPNDQYFRRIRDVVTDEIEEEEDAETILKRLERTITQPELPTDVDYVRVMSLHKAKGLEADLVVVLGCVQGLIPYFAKFSNDADRSRKLEEQRRLFYVAITRAKRHLLLSTNRKLPARVRYKIDFKSWTGNSRFVARTSDFLGELGPRCPIVQSTSDFLQKYGT